MAWPALPVYRHGLEPKLPKSKKVSFIFTQNQPDTRRFLIRIATFMQMVGLIGLSVKDYLVAYDLDAGIKAPVTEKKEFTQKAYRIGNMAITPILPGCDHTVPWGIQIRIIR